MSSFDLDSLNGLSAAQEAGLDVEILHPKTGEPLGITVKVAGPDSAKQKSARSAVVDDRIAKKIRRITPKRVEDEANMMVANSIISWSGVIVSGQTIDFSVENAVGLFERFPFIREQIQSQSDDRGNFIKT